MPMGEAEHGHAWTSPEITAMTTAVTRAPSVHNVQPWQLQVRDRTAVLSERPGIELATHDPFHRDRDISGGAALSNLVLAVRNTGWDVDITRATEDDDLVATVVATAASPPDETERRCYAAIPQRSSYRRPFKGEPLTRALRDELVETSAAHHVDLHWLHGHDEALALARLLVYAANAHRDDVPYQRELAAWLAVDQQDPGVGVPTEALGEEGLPAVGLTTEKTPLPDEQRLADRIHPESVLVISTSPDTRVERMRAGEAMQRLWLELTSRGLVASVMTQPLRLGEVRAALPRYVDLRGVPQLIMRIGVPSQAPPRRSARRSENDVLREPPQ